MKPRWGTWRHRMVVCTLLLAAATSHAQTPAGNTAAERPVVAIRIINDHGRILSEAPNGLNVEVGKPLERGKLAESIKKLYATGDYADLKAVTSPEGSGVLLDFVVRENLFFNQVVIEG